MTAAMGVAEALNRLTGLVDRSLIDPAIVEAITEALRLGDQLADAQRQCIQDEINALEPPKHLTAARKEYWKAGAFAAVEAINRAYRATNSRGRND
jgi:hypothetical protein